MEGGDRVRPEGWWQRRLEWRRGAAKESSDSPRHRDNPSDCDLAPHRHFAALHRSPVTTKRPRSVCGCASVFASPESDYQLGKVVSPDERKREETEKVAANDATVSKTAKFLHSDSAKAEQRQTLWKSLKLATTTLRFNKKYRNDVREISQSIPNLRRSSDAANSLGEAAVADELQMGEADSSQYITFLVKILLKEGVGLAIRDASGSSDPYVKFKYKNHAYYKSNIVFKNLNPVWDEEFSYLIDDPTVPIVVDVYDYDRFAADDYMGGAIIDLSQLSLFQRMEMTLKLHEEGNAEDLGYISVSVTVNALTSREKDEFLRRAVRSVVCENVKQANRVTQLWSSVASIILIEGKHLLPAEGSRIPPDPFVKFKLGQEKYKSKTVTRSTNPQWVEQFHLHMFDEPKHVLEVMVNDKRTNACLGTCNVDLDKLAKETTHRLCSALDQSTGSIYLLVSITGTAHANKVIDLNEAPNGDISTSCASNYALMKTMRCWRDVGYLTVKVYRARDLAAADIGGKSDPFVVLELINARLQTHTEYKTLNPEWNKLFTFAVEDMTSVLEVTVNDEDPNNKAEFLGKIAVPLFKIRNNEKRWFALKKQKLDGPAKGHILLEMAVVWNPVRAAIRTFTPKERKYMETAPRFKRHLFIKNFSRLKVFLLNVIAVRDYLQSCFNWDSPPRSISAFVVFIAMVYFFEVYHVPLLLLALFLKSHRSQSGFTRETSVGDSATCSSFDDDEEDENTVATVEERSASTLKERLNAVQETLAMVQNSMDFVASLLERVKNTFNFTQPFLSMLAIAVLSMATLILYVVPLRWLILLWGINKFTKKLRNPNFIPNNEVLDFLSRVPSDAETKAFSEPGSELECA